MNSNAENMSRRDLFRRPKVSPSNLMLGASSESVGITQVTSVPLPASQDGEDLQSLPPMVEAQLDTNQLNSLFHDIESLGSDIQLFQRLRSPSRETTESVSVLKLARDSLLNGKTNKIQIRYRWDSRLWIDTLERQLAGFRLIRIAHAR